MKTTLLSKTLLAVGLCTASLLATAGASTAADPDPKKNASATTTNGKADTEAPKWWALDTRVVLTNSTARPLSVFNTDGGDHRENAREYFKAILLPGQNLTMQGTNSGNADVFTRIYNAEKDANGEWVRKNRVAQISATNPSSLYPKVVLNAGARDRVARSTGAVSFSEGESRDLALPGVASVNVKREPDCGVKLFKIRLDELSNQACGTWKGDGADYSVKYTGITFTNTTKRPLALHRLNRGNPDGTKGENFHKVLESGESTYLEGWESDVDSYDVAFRLYETSKSADGTWEQGKRSLTVVANNPSVGYPVIGVRGKSDQYRQLKEHETDEDWGTTDSHTARLHRDADSDCKHLRMTLKMLAAAN